MKLNNPKIYLREELNQKIKKIIFKLVKLTGKSTNEIMKELQGPNLKS